MLVCTSLFSQARRASPSASLGPRHHEKLLNSSRAHRLAAAKRVLEPRLVRQVRASAEGGDGDGNKGGDSEQAATAAGKRERVKAVEQNLKQLGIDRSTARRVLQIWKQAGATNPDTLRQLFLKRSRNKSVALLAQLGLDTISSLGAFYTGHAIGVSRSFGPTWSLAAEYLAYFVGMYLGISAALDLFGLVALQVATLRYSTNAEAFLLAVQELAGKEATSGLEIVNKARKAVSMVKVIQALQSILDLLQDQKGSDQEFFEALGAYLTLERAQRLFKFDAAKYNLSDSEAAEIATIFARFDTNDDGLLDLQEFKRLCAATAPHLSSEEVEAALGVLDLDSSGSIDFGEWVQWWVNKGKPPSEQQQQQQEALAARE